MRFDLACIIIEQAQADLSILFYTHRVEPHTTRQSTKPNRDEKQNRRVGGALVLLERPVQHQIDKLKLSF